MLFIVGCNQFNSADIEGFIEEIKNDRLTVQITGEPPESNYTEYAVFEIIVNDETKIEGTVNRFEDLKEGDEIKFRVEDFEAKELIAELIIVQ